MWVLVPFLVFLPLRLPAWLVLGFWFVLQAVYSSGEGVFRTRHRGVPAHVVGFLAGMLLAWPLQPGHSPAAGAARPAVRPAGPARLVSRPGTRG